jgi:hypothetical protein
MVGIRATQDTYMDAGGTTPWMEEVERSICPWMDGSRAMQEQLPRIQTRAVAEKSLLKIHAICKRLCALCVSVVQVFYFLLIT